MEYFTSELTSLTGSYDLRLVGVSVLIAVAMSYSGFELTERIMASRGRVRAVWLLCGALAIGIGRWASDYIGLLAFQLPVPIQYHYPTLILALMVADCCPWWDCPQPVRLEKGSGSRSRPVLLSVQGGR